MIVMMMMMMATMVKMKIGYDNEADGAGRDDGREFEKGLTSNAAGGSLFFILKGGLRESHKSGAMYKYDRQMKKQREGEASPSRSTDTGAAADEGLAGDVHVRGA
jgi:hypothetical protein